MCVKWEINKIDDENAQKVGSLHATSEITVPNAYMFQVIKLENTKTGKLSEETQVT